MVDLRPGLCRIRIEVEHAGVEMGSLDKTNK